MSKSTQFEFEESLTLKSLCGIRSRRKLSLAYHAAVFPTHAGSLRRDRSGIMNSVMEIVDSQIAHAIPPRDPPSFCSHGAACNYGVVKQGNFKRPSSTGDTVPSKSSFSSALRLCLAEPVTIRTHPVTASRKPRITHSQIKPVHFALYCRRLNPRRTRRIISTTRGHSSGCLRTYPAKAQLDTFNIFLWHN